MRYQDAVIVAEDHPDEQRRQEYKAHRMRQKLEMELLLQHIKVKQLYFVEL